jgi:hypothetical protein
VVFAHAWAPAQSRRIAEPASVSLEQIKQELRARRAKAQQPPDK